jgi:hypothetical protein
MAADCKSAAPCELRRFESSPVHQVFWMKFWIAMGAFVVLAVLAAVTIEDQKFKLATLAILAMFALRTLAWSRKQDREREEDRDE